MATPGARNLLTDVAGLAVGHAEDRRVITGVTVILADWPVAAGVAIAGGGPGTRETDLLGQGRLVAGAVDAICLSGGSAFGLAAADGVMAGLKAAGRGYAFADRSGIPPTPLVPAAILYDLANGGDKDWGEAAPYAGLGLAAFRAAAPDFRLGRAGAAYGARAGLAPGGLGSASFVTADGLTVGALVAVNSFGSVRVPGSDAFWAWPFEIGREFGGARPDPAATIGPEDWGAAKLDPAPRANTTLACIAVDADLSADECHRLAWMALAGLARAIRPVFTPVDGDVVFALATARRPLPEPRAIGLARLGELAATTLARAVARGVWLAEQQD